MKVKCIDNLDGGLNLTIGKEYEVYKSTLDEHTTYYQLKNDFGTTQYYPQRHFEVVNERDYKQQIKLQCSSCLHEVICGHRDEWKRYCEEHIELRKKSILFDVEPSCRYYIDKDRVEFLLAKDDKDKAEAYKQLVKPYEEKETINEPITEPISLNRYPKWNYDSKIKTEEDLAKILERILNL